MVKDTVFDRQLRKTVYRGFNSNESRKAERWLVLLESFRKKFGKCSFDNRLTLYSSGDSAYKEMFDCIDTAKERVWLEVYIFDDSFLAETMIYKLRSAKRRGCDVILLIDYFGSLKIKNAWLKCLEEDQIPVIFFNPVKLGFNIYPFSSSYNVSKSVGPIAFRDHRKILICDNTAFTGSMNVSADAAGPLLGNRTYYDVHVKIQGPAAADISEIFLDSLTETKSNLVREPIDRKKLFNFPNLQNELISQSLDVSLPSCGCYVQVLQSNVRKNKREIQSVMWSSINQAAETVHLATGYFLPPGFLRRALVNAANRKVQVSLLLSGNSDVPAVVPASMHVLRKIAKKVVVDGSITAYLTMQRHCHAKTLVVDNIWAELGTFNWDRYSSRRNLEVDIAVFDRTFATKLRHLHERVVSEESEKIELKKYLHPLVRIYWLIAYNAARLAGNNIMDGLSNEHYKPLVRRAIIHKYLEESVGSIAATGMVWGFD